ncbi:hypothetical protein HYDPIDRAFT_28039 [Hydnomerulius pinastri MD-312]|uniref:Uncharacterized protein n=1 Tax=Hydnomerulius pinastri MD-312 TaxID=994086 RepID=A0A0C9VI36_9AGAM|nr:hypothetical protein HYDPIDRAFT_28039 [Hydnomerulius pinastri MD-312]
MNTDLEAGNWMSEFLRVKFHRAKANVDHCTEEVALLKMEMQWAVNFFWHHSDKWKRFAAEAEAKRDMGKDAMTALIGQATLLGLNPTSHPVLQYVARNAAAMEAEGFDIADIPPFEWDPANSAYRAIVMAPADAWWEDLHVLREDLLGSPEGDFRAIGRPQLSLSSTVTLAL